MSLVFESQEDSKAKKMALYMLMIAVLSAIAMVVVASEPTTETPVQTTTTSPETSSSDGAALLTVESQRLHELSQQVSQSNRALQDLLAAKLRDVNYATLISELRAEIDSLRHDLLQMKEEKALGAGSASSTSENSHKTVHWMQSSVAEMKAEMVELNRALNVSRQLQQTQETQNQWKLMRDDLRQLQNSVAESSARQQSTQQSLQMVNDELQRMQQQQSTHVARINQLDHQVSEVRLGLETSLRSREPSVELSRRGRQRRSMSSNEHATRHGRRQDDSLHRETRTLRKMVKTLAAEQHDLQAQMLVLSKMRLTTESNLNKIQDELAIVFQHNGGTCSQAVARLESQQQQMNETLSALEVKAAGVDQVQSSTLQLFEAIQKLQDRYDENISQLDSEVSRLEFGDAQLSSDVHTMRQDQADINDQLRSIKAQQNLVQESLKAQMVRSALIQTQLADATVIKVATSHMEDVQNWRLASLEHQFARVAQDLPHDCREVSTTGVNSILPRGSDQVIKVFCDQQVSGGGWTVVQRRTDGKEDFNRNWAAYKSGFGKVDGEFWLGNDHLHRLTQDKTTMLRVDLWDIYGQYWWAEYDTFFVDDEKSGYMVKFDGYHGNASDAMASYHQNMKFSTRDNDQDLSNTNCADSYQGGWWYSHCQHVNINGKYALGLTWYDSLENEWIALAKVEMKIRDKRIFNH